MKTVVNSLLSVYNWFVFFLYMLLSVFLIVLSHLVLLSGYVVCFFRGSLTGICQ